MREICKRGLPAALVAAALWLGAGPAQAASDPLFFFGAPEKVPPGTGFEAPCGIAVDGSANFYVSDYHHDAIDVFTPARGYLTQLAAAPGPCAVAIDSAGRLYVNRYHREVTRYSASPYPITTLSTFGPPSILDQAQPTGVSVDPLTSDLYVDERGQIERFDSSGAPLGAIGAASLGDGYGVAVSRYPNTAGFIYVPDAANDKVKVYDPASDAQQPTAELEGPNGGFASLRDSAIAVDRVDGEVYVADAIGPADVERPEARIYVFGPTGNYEGHLKYDVIDAHPVGLAVDNSPTATQGRVYVTSGNSEGAGVYAYGPGSATTQNPLCAPGGFCGGVLGGGSAKAASSAQGPAAPTSLPPRSQPRASASGLAQKGRLRIAVSGSFSPQRLPREGTAPIAVSVGGQISTTDESLPPQLTMMQIELNRNGHLSYEGLPACSYSKIQPASTSRALAGCRSSLVGKGSFSAAITLAGQEPYPTRGRLVLFNGKKGKRPVIYGHIYAAKPFATSFVIVFTIAKHPKGTYGTVLRARLPKAMEAWGRLTSLEMTLSRKFKAKGRSQSFLSAGCPAPKGFSKVPFPLARTSFAFAGGTTLSSVLSDTCRVG